MINDINWIHLMRDCSSELSNYFNFHKRIDKTELIILFTPLLWLWWQKMKEERLFHWWAGGRTFNNFIDVTASVLMPLSLSRTEPAFFKWALSDLLNATPILTYFVTVDAGYLWSLYTFFMIFITLFVCFSCKTSNI